MGIPLRLFLVFIVFGIVLIGIAIGVVRNILKNRAPNRKKLQEDIKQMRAEIKPWLQQLAPIDEDGLGLFSLNQVNQILKKGINKSAKGMYVSIYQEPILAYTYKEYLGNNALLYARTAQKEWVYQIESSETHIAVDGSFFGTLKNDGKLYREQTVLASFDQRDAELHLPIKIGQREVAALNNITHLDAPEPRAFQYVSAKVTTTEEQTILALAILKIVQQMIDEA